MSAKRFNAAISVVGIKEPKETYDRKVRELRSEVQQLRQMIANRT